MVDILFSKRNDINQFKCKFFENNLLFNRIGKTKCIHKLIYLLSKIKFPIWISFEFRKFNLKN